MAEQCLLFLDDSQVEESDFSPSPEHTTDLDQQTDSNDWLSELDEDYGMIVVALIKLGFLPDRRHKGWLPSVVERRKDAPGLKIEDL